MGSGGRRAGRAPSWKPTPSGLRRIEWCGASDPPTRSGEPRCPFHPPEGSIADLFDRRASAVPVAWRLLRHDRARFALTVTGVGATVALVLFLFSVYEGVRSEAIGYVASRPVDVWMSHRNSTNLVRSVSYLPESLLAGVRVAPGVERVSPLLRVIATTRIRGRQATFFVLGVDPASPVTRPGVVEGRSVPRPGELVVDAAFARRHGLGIGDELRLQEETFRIAGLSEGTNALVTHFAFATLDDGQRLLGFDDILSYLLVEAEEGVSPEALAEELAVRFDDLSSFTAERFVANNLEEMRSGVLPLLWSVAAFGAATGAVVLTLLLYGGVVERRADYALLAAVGAGRRWIAGVVLRQAAVVVVAGLAAGGMLYLVAVPLFRWLVPGMSFALAPWVAVTGCGVGLGLGVFAAWIPVLRLRGIHPGEVFRP